MNTRIYTLLASVALLCVACDNDTNPMGSGNFPSDNKVRISTELEALQTKADPAPPYTGSNLSLSIDYGMGSPFSRTNATWLTMDNGVSWVPANQMLWKDATTPAKVYAYAPAVGVEGGDIEDVPFTIVADQSASLIPSDLLVYKDEAFVPGSSLTSKKALNIIFKHALAKLVVNLSYDDLWGENPPAINEVTINGTKPNTVLNAKTGITATASGDVTTIKPCKIETTTGMAATFEAIVVPQTVQPGSDLIYVQLENGDTDLYMVATTKGVTFEAGKQYVINVQIAKYETRLSGITKSKWDTI